MESKTAAVPNNLNQAVLVPHPEFQAAHTEHSRSICKVPHETQELPE